MSDEQTAKALEDAAYIRAKLDAMLEVKRQEREDRAAARKELMEELREMRVECAATRSRLEDLEHEHRVARAIRNGIVVLIGLIAGVWKMLKP